MVYTLTIYEGVPPSMQIERFEFSTIEELEQLPPVRRQIESLPPDADEVAMFEHTKLITAAVSLPPGFEIQNEPPDGMQFHMDPDKLILVPVAPWATRLESAFVRLIQVEQGPLGIMLYAERKMTADMHYAEQGDLIQDQIGLMREPVPGIPVVGGSWAYREALRILEAVEREWLDYEDEGWPGWSDVPDSGGWWMWSEGGDTEPRLLLLCDDGTEVAGDSDYCTETGQELSDDGPDENYWEMTSTKEMPGKWRKAAADKNANT